MIRDRVTSKNKDKYQESMDKLFYELTGKVNKPKQSWYKYTKEEVLAFKEKKNNGKRKFSK